MQRTDGRAPDQIRPISFDLGIAPNASGSVLVATQSGYAAEVLGAMLARYPGPVPILFGDAERRDTIATEREPRTARRQHRKVRRPARAGRANRWSSCKADRSR